MILTIPIRRFLAIEKTTQLYATQNKTELRKLKAIPQSQAKNRYLLLVDLRGIHDFHALKLGYEKELPPGRLMPLCGLRHVKRGQGNAGNFRLEGKGKKKL